MDKDIYAGQFIVIMDENGPDSGDELDEDLKDGMDGGYGGLGTGKVLLVNVPKGMFSHVVGGQLKIAYKDQTLEAL